MLLEHDALNADWAIANLRASMDVDLGDPLRFQISDPKAPTQGADEQGRSVEIKVAAYIGATLFDSFSIDLSTRPRLVGEVELLEPQPVIEMAGMKAGPQIAVYPLADQIADKICAMYEVHGSQQRPSTRYRDLVDLVLIATTQRFDAQLAAEALCSEQARRGLTVATPLAMPSSQWTSGYRSTARDAGLAPALQDAAAALHLCNQCFEPILTGAITAGSWDFTSMTWR